MKKVLFICIFCFFCVYYNHLHAADEKFVVVIDAGHGGKDGGAVRGTYKEKDINLGVALMLGKFIESNMKDVKVVYTRKSDVFVDLYKRSEIANKAKANLFISIHTNSTASKETTASGADTYILGLARSDENLAVAKRENSVIMLEDNYTKRYEGFDPNSPESNILFEFMTNKYMDQSLEFATYTQNGFSKVAKRVDRGVAQAGFLVLRESGMPSVLIELGFINNPTEAKYLSSAVGQRSMASAIYSGFEKYKKNFDNRQGKSVAVNNTKPKVVETKEYISETTVSPSVDPIATTSTTTKSKTQFFSKNNDPSTLVVSNKEPEKVVSKPRVAEKPRVVEKPKVPEVKSTTTTTNVPPTAKTPSAAPIVDNFKQESSISPEVIEYRVQFLTSSSNLGSNSSAFKGLSPVDSYRDGGIYKYTYGSTTSEAEAQRMMRQARANFKDAFIVKFKNGVRIK